jgi:hypothetical protein
MTALLARILHPVSTATIRDPERQVGSTGPRKVGKTRRRRLLAVLAVPPLVAVFSLLSTGIASAADQYWNGPDLPYGPYVVHTQAHASVSCNAYLHQLQVSATAYPLDGVATSEQVYLYVWQNNGWQRYPPGGTVYNQTLSGTMTYPPGIYDVIVQFGWRPSDGNWRYTNAEVTSYTEWRSGYVDSFPRYCYL